jgi:hypothetical protein
VPNAISCQLRAYSGATLHAATAYPRALTDGKSPRVCCTRSLYGTLHNRRLPVGGTLEAMQPAAHAVSIEAGSPPSILDGAPRIRCDAESVVLIRGDAEVLKPITCR